MIKVLIGQVTFKHTKEYIQLGDKPYKCDKGFNLSSHLQAHTNVVFVVMCLVILTKIEEYIQVTSFTNVMFVIKCLIDQIHCNQSGSLQKYIGVDKNEEMAAILKFKIKKL